MNFLSSPAAHVLIFGLDGPVPCRWSPAPQSDRARRSSRAPARGWEALSPNAMCPELAAASWAKPSYLSGASNSLSLVETEVILWVPLPDRRLLRGRREGRQYR